jgi:hypothetical protein
MLSLKTDVFVPTERNQQKIFRKIWYFVGTLIATADKSRIRIQRHMRICNQSTDPKIRIRIKMAQLRSTAPYSVLRGKSVTHTKIIIFGFQKQIRIRETNPRQNDTQIIPVPSHVQYSTILQKNRVGSGSSAGSVQIITDPEMKNWLWHEASLFDFSTGQSST